MLVMIVFTKTTDCCPIKSEFVVLAAQIEKILPSSYRLVIKIHFSSKFELSDSTDCRLNNINLVALWACLIGYLVLASFLRLIFVALGSLVIK